jgi:plasmid stabilization system protein ParE
MDKIIWSTHSEKQLDLIFNFYLHNVNNSVAFKILSNIINHTSILKNNPHLGQIEPLLKNKNFSYRYIVYSHFKIIYHVDANNKTIKISDIFDSRQNPSKLDII